MKDSEIRTQLDVLKTNISMLSDIIHNLIHRVDNKGELLVQHCDTCAHETMQIKRRDYHTGPPLSYPGPFMPTDGAPSTVYYVCLGCGSKFRLFPTNRSEPYVPSCDQPEKK